MTTPTTCPHPPFTWGELCRLVTDMEDGAVSVVICPVCGAFHALVVHDPFQEMG
jgi:hypothetical protein